MSWVYWLILGLLVLVGLAYLVLRFLGFCILAEVSDECDYF